MSKTRQLWKFISWILGSFIVGLLSAGFYQVKAQDSPASALQETNVGSTTLTVEAVAEVQQVSQTCYQWVIDQRDAGSWERGMWSNAPTGGEIFWDANADGAYYGFSVTEDSSWGTPVSATFYWYRFIVAPTGAGAYLIVETVKNGAGTGQGWLQPSQDVSQTPTRHQGNSSDPYVTGAIIRTNGGKKLGWDELIMVKCYQQSQPTPTNTPISTATPTNIPPTATPSPTPTPTATNSPTPRPTATATPSSTSTPAAGDTSMVIPPAAPVVQSDALTQQCVNQYLAMVAGGSVAVSAAEVQEVQVFPPVKALRSCIEPQLISFPGPTGMCLNRKRVLVVKDAQDAENGWAVEYRCTDTPQGPVILGTTTTIDPVSGLVAGAMAIALGLYYWNAQPTTIEIVWEPHVPNEVAAAGTMIAQTWAEAEDWLLSMAYKPATVHYGSPTSYAQLFDGEALASTVRFYRPVSESLWTQNVWFYNATDRSVDGDTVAMLQLMGVGTLGTTLSSYIITTRSDGTPGMSLWDTIAHLLAFGYEVPEALEGVRERNGTHSSDGDALATSKKDALWYTHLNWAKSFTNLNKMPPWNWCGFRESDGACTCVNYYLEVFRMAVNGAGELVKKTTKGISVILNSNSTVIGDLKPTVSGAQSFTEDARPSRLFKAEEWKTINPNDPNDPYKDRCPSDFGLQFAN